MELTSLAIIAALAAVTALVLFRRPGRVRATGPDQDRRPAVTRKSSEPVRAAAPAVRRMCTHAVSVESDSMVCDAARKLGDQRFLSAEAPPLPLPGCDRGRCECRYVHHEDRRVGEERRMPFTAFGGFGLQSPEGERRKRLDRRGRR
jgi:hypothetical protein